MSTMLTRQALLGGLTAIAEIAVGERQARISIAGNRFTLIDEAGNETPWPYLQLPIVALAFNPAPVRRMYLKPFVQGQDDQAPDCRSDNGVQPAPDSPAPQSATCAACPMNAFGTALNGKGKRCAEYARLAVAVVGDESKRAYAFNIPPASRTSLKAYADSLSRQMKGQYPATMGDVVTMVGFERQGILNFAPHTWTDAVADLNPLLDAICGAQDIEALIGLKQAALPPPPAAVAPQIPVGGPQWQTPSPSQTPAAPVMPVAQPAAPPSAMGAPISAAPPMAAPPSMSGGAPRRGRPRKDATVPNPGMATPVPPTGSPMATPSTSLPPMQASPAGLPPMQAMPSGLPPMQASPPVSSAPSSDGSSEQQFGMAMAPAPDADIQEKLRAAMGLNVNGG